MWRQAFGSGKDCTKHLDARHAQVRNGANGLLRADGFAGRASVPTSALPSRKNALPGSAAFPGPPGGRLSTRVYPDPGIEAPQTTRTDLSATTRRPDHRPDPDS